MNAALKIGYEKERVRGCTVGWSKKETRATRQRKVLKET